MDYLKEAMRIHRESPLVDAHLDLAYEIYNRNQVGESGIIKKYYLDHLRKAGVRIVVSSLFIPSLYLPEMGLRMALNQMNALVEDIKLDREHLMLIQDKKDLERVLAEDKIGFLMSFEGLEPIMNDSGLLHIFYRLGVRGAGLVWNRRNYVADGNFSKENQKGRRGGLTEFGVEVVKKCEGLPLFIDVSHLNDEGFEDVLRYTHRPFIASHSNARALYPVKRNLTDWQIKAIAERGGLIGINAEKSLLGPAADEEPIKTIVNHIDYMVNLVGYKSLGLGLDLCAGGTDTELRFGKEKKLSQDGLRSHEEILLITVELLKRGYPQEAIKDILGRNFLNYLRLFL